MSLENAIFHHLKNNAGVSALVGTRIYRIGNVPSSVTAAQSYLSYQRISTTRTDHQTAADTLTDARVQFNCFAPTDTTAQDTADAVRTAFKHYTGAMGEAGKTITVKSARVRDESADVIEPHDGGQVGKFRRILDVLFWYSE